MSFRPVCDFWILASPKVHYYGAYPNGFLERARTILGCSTNDSILHVCGGMAKVYPNKKAYGPNDKTLDIDPALQPDFCQDVKKGIPQGDWKAILIDPPYTLDDAKHYSQFNGFLPEPNELVRNAINSVEIGRCVGLLHYIIPACPKNGKEVALIAVCMGHNNRIRCFSVFRRIE
jgi:hypothetical protein